jgi:pimeloyl-ACP methyl ester carboxylesterase
MEALRGTTAAGFRTLFLLFGPNSALGHNSIVYIIEAQIDYVLKALDAMQASGAASVVPTREAQQRDNRRVQADLAGSVWLSGGSTSYYLDAGGRNTTLWTPRWARDDGSVSETENPIDGTRISFEVRGEGAPLLLVHGSALSRSIWRGFGYVAALQDRNRVIAIDLRGHGRSGKPYEPEAYRMPLVLADILAVLDAVDAPAAHLFGYSFGARAGFSLADSHPERMLSLISAGGTYRAPGGSVSELFFPGYDAALCAGGMAGFLDGWAAHSGGPIDAQTTGAFLANDPLALRAYFRQVELESGIADDRLAQLETPILLLAGTRDHERYIDSERAATLMPHASFRALPGRTHGNTLRPATEVLDVVIPFLASLDA